MKIKLILPVLLCFFSITAYSQKKQASLIPEQPSQAPDYFCTWNVQGYVTSYGPSTIMRKAMIEQNIYGKGTLEGWASMFSKLHKDLYLVLDDDWETPLKWH